MLNRPEEDIREAFEDTEILVDCGLWMTGEKSSIPKSNMTEILYVGYKAGALSQQEKIVELEEVIFRHEKTIENFTKSLKDAIKEKWDYAHKIDKQLSEKDKQIEEERVRNCRLVEECIELKKIIEGNDSI